MVLDFIRDYWQFLVAGLIVLAIVIYWVVETSLAKKAREKELLELEKQYEEEVEAAPAEAAVEAPAKEKEAKKPAKEKVEEVSEKPEEKEELGAYIVTYDKAKRDWVV